jgi:hypothetical protein
MKEAKQNAVPERRKFIRGIVVENLQPRKRVAHGPPLWRKSE